MPRGTLDSARSFSAFAYGAFTLSGRLFQNRSAGIDGNFLRSEPRDWPKPFPVWALPLSLAATYGITFVFSSSAYLDVSVQRVPPAWLCIRHAVTGVRPGRVSTFRHPRIIAHLQLPAAFRSLSRLSSAPGAKASVLRPF